jgi:hypothetical protein
MPYSARPTTTGNQDALAFPKEFSRDHPELFRGRCEVHLISDGTFLLTSEPRAEPQAEDDPVFGAFLGFLERGMSSRPDLITPFTHEDVAGLDELLADVPSGEEVDWDSFELP